jgi:hypothetical protein
MRQLVILQENAGSGMAKIPPADLPQIEHLPGVKFMLMVMSHEFVDSIQINSPIGKIWFVALDVPMKTDYMHDIMPSPNEPVDSKAMLDEAWRATYGR